VWLGASGFYRRIGRIAVLAVIAASATAGSEVLARDQLVTPRFDFRPLSRADDKAAFPVRRPQASSPRSSGRTAMQLRLPDITDGRKGSRKAMPITRGQELGLRFRPDKRDPVQGPAGALPGTGARSQVGADTAFRPVTPGVRPSYEELQAQRQGGVMPPPMRGGYALPPGSPPFPPVGLPWGAW